MFIVGDSKVKGAESRFPSSSPQYIVNRLTKRDFRTRIMWIYRNKDSRDFEEGALKMQKWEYGFLTFKNHIEENGLGGRNSQVHSVAFFKGNSIASGDYLIDMRQPTNDDSWYETAFNTLEIWDGSW